MCMEQHNIKTLARLIKKERKVAKRLRRALQTFDLKKVPELRAKHRELTSKIHELLPPPVEP